jgi:4'-phosphopantetheinyl transferase
MLETATQLVGASQAAPCSLWLVSLAQAVSAADLATLSPDERIKALHFVHERDRRRYQVAHVALRELLAQRVGVAPADLGFDAGRFGKPRLVGVPACAFSLSRSGDWAAIALAADGEIGVDIELLRAMPDRDSMAAMCFTPVEREQMNAAPFPSRDNAFLHCWTRKEACLKAIGTGLSVPPDRFEAGADTGERELKIPTPGAAARVIVESLPEQHGVLIAIARSLSGRHDL